MNQHNTFRMATGPRRQPRPFVLWLRESIPREKSDQLGALEEDSLPNARTGNLTAAPGIPEYMRLTADECNRLLFWESQAALDFRLFGLNPFDHLGDDHLDQRAEIIRLKMELHGSAPC